MKLSANLGMLWTELDLLEAMHAAHSAGFAAVETYWPYITRSVDVALVLEELGIPMISLNTVGGDLAKREFGLAALPGREDEARAAIDKAMAYALDVSARHVHVLAGRVERDAASTEVYMQNISYAGERGAAYGIDVLIEPISHVSQTDYFLHDVDQAAEILAALDAPNVRMLFDCFHVASSGGNVAELLEEHLDLVGHVQLASVPERGAPVPGSADTQAMHRVLEAGGYEGFVAGEYIPAGRTEDSLAWMADFN